MKARDGGLCIGCEVLASTLRTALPPILCLCPECFHKNWGRYFAQNQGRDSGEVWREWLEKRKELYQVQQQNAPNAKGSWVEITFKGENGHFEVHDGSLRWIQHEPAKPANPNQDPDGVYDCSGAYPDEVPEQ